MSVLPQDSNLQVSDILGNQKLFISGEPQTPQEWNFIFETYKITKIIRCLPTKLDPNSNAAHAFLLQKLSSENSLLTVPVHDIPIESLVPYFSEATQFVTKHLFPTCQQQEDHQEEIIEKVSNKQETNKDERILVFCQQGVSRSVSITLSILVAIGGKLFFQENKSNENDDQGSSFSGKNFMFLSEALEIVKKSRPQARPNIGFMEQVANWEKLQYANCNKMENNNSNQESTASSSLLLFNVDEYCFQGYKKRFATQISENLLRDVFEKNKRTRNAAYMQQLVFDRLIEINSTTVASV